MRGDVIRPDELPEEKCHACNKGISPQQARNAQMLTHEIGGSDGTKLCRQCLDKNQRRW
jgi:hypothetical protein